MWVLQDDQLFNLRHVADLWLEGRFIRMGFVDGSGASLSFDSEEKARRFFQVVVMRLGRLDGILVAGGMKDDVPQDHPGGS